MRNVIFQKKLPVPFSTQLFILIDYRFIVFLQTNNTILSIYTKKEKPRIYLSRMKQRYIKAFSS